MNRQRSSYRLCPLDSLLLAVPLAFLVRFVPGWKNETLLFFISGIALMGTELGDLAVKERQKSAWPAPKAFMALAVAAIFIAVMSEFLAGSAEAACESLGLTEVFAGVIIIAVIGNAIERVERRRPLARFWDSVRTETQYLEKALEIANKLY